MRTMLLLLIALVVVISSITLPAFADWNIGEGYKMKELQLPDKYGLDINFTHPKVLADDWKCSKSGDVDDIHFWFSARGDKWFDEFFIIKIHVSIHENDPGPPSKPGALKWNRDFELGQFKIRKCKYGENQGWYDPEKDKTELNDHTNIYQCNIEHIAEPFFQYEGNIYWLDISIETKDNLELGWKTTKKSHYDIAVWRNWGDDEWKVLKNNKDLAFVITNEPEIPVKDRIYRSRNESVVSFLASDNIEPGTSITLTAQTPVSMQLNKGGLTQSVDLMNAAIDVEIGPDVGGFSHVTVTFGRGEFDTYVFGGQPIGASTFTIQSGEGWIDNSTGEVGAYLNLRVFTIGFQDIIASAHGSGQIVGSNTIELFEGAEGLQINTTTSTPIPTLSNWILTVLALILLTGTVLLIWRRRRAAA